MQISMGLPQKYLEDAVEIYLSEFGDKLSIILGSDERAKEVLMGAVNSSKCLIAEEDGKLMGILAFQVDKDSFIYPSQKEMSRIYGFGQGWLRYIGLLIFNSSIKDSLYISEIAVSPAARGKGIGTKLIEEIEDYGLQWGMKEVTLKVIEPNVGAKSLYERLGFCVTKREDIRPVNKIFGWPFKAIYHMRKTLI